MRQKSFRPTDPFLYRVNLDMTCSSLLVRIQPILQECMTKQSRKSSNSQTKQLQFQNWISPRLIVMSLSRPQCIQACLECVQCTVWKLYSGTLIKQTSIFNEVFGITKNFLQPSQNYSNMFGTEPRFNKILIIINTIHKHKRKMYLDIMNKCQYVIKDECQTDQQR